MSFLLFILLALALYLAYRYINAHENLVRQVQSVVLATNKPEPEPFDLRDTVMSLVSKINKK